MIPALSPVETGSSRAGDLAALWRDHDDLWNARTEAAAAALPAGGPQPQLPQWRNNAIDAPTRSAPLWLVASVGARLLSNRRSSHHKSAQERPNQDGQAELPRWERMLPEEFPAVDGIPDAESSGNSIAVDRVYSRPILPDAGPGSQLAAARMPTWDAGSGTLTSVARLADRQRTQAARCFVDVPWALAHVWAGGSPLVAAA